MAEQDVRRVESGALKISDIFDAAANIPASRESEVLAVGAEDGTAVDEVVALFVHDAIQDNCLPLFGSDDVSVPLAIGAEDEGRLVFLSQLRAVFSSFAIHDDAFVDEVRKVATVRANPIGRLAFTRLRQIHGADRAQ